MTCSIVGINTGRILIAEAPIDAAMVYPALGNDYIDADSDQTLTILCAAYSPSPSQWRRYQEDYEGEHNPRIRR